MVLAGGAHRPVHFEIYRTATPYFWLCGNDALISGAPGDVTCTGERSALDYADQAEEAIGIGTYISTLMMDETVTDRLCATRAVLVFGSASSSPSEGNKKLPLDRANTLSAAVRSQLGKRCLSMPQIIPLSLGVAGCGGSGETAPCTAASDRAEDRQIIMVGVQSSEETSIARGTLSEEISHWMASPQFTDARLPVLHRVLEPDGFDFEEIIWADSHEAAHIRITHSNAGSY